MRAENAVVCQRVEFSGVWKIARVLLLYFYFRIRRPRATSFSHPELDSWSFFSSRKIGRGSHRSRNSVKRRALRISPRVMIYARSVFPMCVLRIKTLQIWLEYFGAIIARFIFVKASLSLEITSTSREHLLPIRFYVPLFYFTFETFATIKARFYCNLHTKWHCCLFNVNLAKQPCVIRKYFVFHGYRP